MSIASPHHRHQTSLEGVINLFAGASALSPQERREATRIFREVIDACEPLQTQEPYKQVTLVRLTYEYARSEASRDNFLRFFFQQTQISTKASLSEPIPAYEYVPRIVAFAQTLLENFFLPCKITLDSLDTTVDIG
jgi:hypothetical protein